MHVPTSLGLGNATLGVLAGLATAVLWTGTALCFEAASRRIGSLAVNVLRLVLAAILFGALSLVRTGLAFPAASSSAWTYLALSGLVGFVVGDVLLFQAFVTIGARLSMLLYSSVPLMTASWGFLFLGERMSMRSVVGMALTVVGIAVAVASKANPSKGPHASASGRAAGIVMALGGSAGQAAGLLLAKRGADGLDSFAATQIRVLAGLAGFLVVVVASGNVGALLGRVRPALSARMASVDESRSARAALGLLSLGALLGPFLGVSLGLLSMQLLPAGTAATLMSIVPVLLIPVSAFVFREAVSFLETAGALAAVLGVAVLVGGAGGSQPAAKQTAAVEMPTPSLPAPSLPAPPPPKHQAECLQCAIEDAREAAHRDQIEVTARYLGLKEKWRDGRRTSLACTRADEVMGIVRFSLVGNNPWREQLSPPPRARESARLIEVELPCPELSRPDYARLYRYDPDDRQRDGLGRAPVLRPGTFYRLTFVRDARVPMREPSHPTASPPVPTLVAVSPLSELRAQ